MLVTRDHQVGETRAKNGRFDQREAMMPPMDSVEAVVARAMRPGLDATEQDVFGTTAPNEIARLIGRFCLTHLGTRPAGARFYASSAGCVVGVQLDTGEDLVLKAFQPRWAAEFLAAVQDVQRTVLEGGIPCPRPSRGPLLLSEYSQSHVVVESWLPDPGMQAPTSTRSRRVSASGLAKQIALCAGLGVLPALANHPLRKPDTELYPEPHSPLFDFGLNAGAARWIDQLAIQAVAIRDADTTRAVVAHTDWSARNVRLNDHQLLAVYDWDSVALVQEATAVGQAAVTWSVTADPGGTRFPTIEEVLNYFSDYEDAAGHQLSEQQWKSAGAAAAQTLAYIARCEHALEAAGIERTDPRAARDRLADAGATLLTLKR
jgi:hypothetical protein